MTRSPSPPTRSKLTDEERIAIRRHFQSRHWEPREIALAAKLWRVSEATIRRTVLYA